MGKNQLTRHVQGSLRLMVLILMTLNGGTGAGQVRQAAGPPKAEATEWMYFMNTFDRVARGEVNNQNISVRRALAIFTGGSKTRLTDRMERRFNRAAEAVRRDNRKSVQYPKLFKEKPGRVFAGAYAISRDQVKIWVIRQVGVHRRSTYYDLLGEYTFKRTPVIDAIFEIRLPWERRNLSIQVIRGVTQRTTKEKKESSLGAGSGAQPYPYSQHIADPSSPRGVMNTLSGIARNTRTGAVVRDKKGRRYVVEGLKRWPENLLNREVQVIGDFIKVSPRPGTKGQSSERSTTRAQLLVKNASWMLLGNK